jgi:Cys-tRNA(Pro) deacylase
VTTPASDELSQKGIPHREFTHPGPVQSLEQAAKERDQAPAQVIRSILFRLRKKEYILVIVSGPEQISWPSLRKHLGISRMRMAKPDEVLAFTGHLVGSVSPFGLANPVRILVEENALAHEEISIGSGVRGTTIFIRPADMLKALEDYEIVRLD